MYPEGEKIQFYETIDQSCFCSEQHVIAKYEEIFHVINYGMLFIN